MLLLLLAAVLPLRAASGADEAVLCVYGPFTSLAPQAMAAAILFDLDFRKNFDPDLVARFGPPIVQVPELSPDLRLKIQLGTDNSDGKVGMRMALDMFQGIGGQEPIVGLIGGFHSAITMPIAELANLFEVPQVSYASTNPKLSNKDQYPWFLRTIPPDSIQGRGMWTFVEHFLLPSVTLVYSQEAYGEGLFQTIVNEASAVGQGFRVGGIGVRYMPDSYVKEEAADKILHVKGMGSKVVMSLMNPSQFLEFAQVARDEGLWSPHWQLVGSNTLLKETEEFIALGYMYYLPVSRSDLFSRFQTMWELLTPEDISSPEVIAKYNVDKFLVDFEDAAMGYPAQDMFDDLSDVRFGPPLAFLFDAAYVFVHAINALLNRGVPIAEAKGQVLLDEVKAVHFMGISGLVAFDDHGDRAASYNLMNVQPASGDEARRLQAALNQTTRSVAIFSAATGRIIAQNGTDVYWMTGAAGAAVPEALVSCLPGFWRDSEGPGASRMCYECEPGTVSSGGQTSRCAPCAAGKAANAARGATDCVICDPGRYSAESKTTTCAPCAPGLSQPLAGGTGCPPCAVGSYAAQSGQTSCAASGEGKKFPELYATQQRVEVHGELKWVPVSGAADAGSCGCTEGAYQKGGECAGCGEGMLCPGNGEVVLKPSYFAASTDPGFVFRCSGHDQLRCPGGLPGTCAYGRLNSTLACAACSAGMRPGRKGACVECASMDWLPFACSACAIVLCVVLLYHVVDTSSPASRSKGVLIIATVGGQMITLFQQLGVFSSISLEWGPPFKDVIEFLSVFTFDLDYLYLDCVASMQPLSRYIGQICTVFLFLALVCAVHLCFCLLRYRCAPFRRLATLYSSLGVIISAFFISIVSSMLSPLQCGASPNGLRTMKAYPSVVCFNDKYGSEHSAMVGIGIAACLLPLGFCAVVAYVAYALPGRLRDGDTTLLRMFGFLFFRFRPGAYWYAVVFLSRSLVLSVVPAIDNTTLQIMILAGTILPIWGATYHVMPWAVWCANTLDVLTQGLLGMVLYVFALFTKDVDAEIVAQLCCVLLSLMWAAVVSVFAFGLYARMARGKKRFRFFICHHKAGAGNLARLLKMCLSSAPQVRGVFIDSDDLQDLGGLFGVVAEDVETLVVLCSKEILSRPWCMGEVTTAKCNGVNTAKVVLPDFRWPPDEFIEQYAQHVPESSMLANHGLSLDMVEASLWWLRDRHGIDFPAQVSNDAMKDLTFALISGSAQAEVQPHATSPGNADSDLNLILVDTRSIEAMSAAIVLMRLLAVIMQHTPAEIPQILDEDCVEIPPASQRICLICTNGVFRSCLVLRILLAAARRNLAVLPVVSEASFRFPSKDFLEELQKDASDRLARMESPDEGSSVVKVVERIFVEIAIEMNPQDVESILKVRAQTVARRLTQGIRKLSLKLNDCSLAGSVGKVSSHGVPPGSEVEDGATEILLLQQSVAAKL